MILHKRKKIIEQRRGAKARRNTARSLFSRVKNKKRPDFSRSGITTRHTGNPVFEVSSDGLDRLTPVFRPEH